MRALLSEQYKIITIAPTEAFMTWLWIAIWTGMGIATPGIVYQIAMFVAPALTRQEKRFILLSLPAVLACFVCGVVFAYFLVIPNALNFLVGFGPNHVGDIEPLIHLQEYIDFVLLLPLWGLLLVLLVGLPRQDVYDLRHVLIRCLELVES